MHFRVAEYLPTREALKEDRKRSITTSLSDLSDLEFLRGAYSQPELAAEKEIDIPSVVPGFNSTTTTTPSFYFGGDAALVEQERRGGVPSMVYESPHGDYQQHPRQGNETGADKGETKEGDNNDSSHSALSSVWGLSFFSSSRAQQE